MLDLQLMIVEDDEQLLSMLAKILSREITIVKPYHKPSEALEALKLFKPDIIITDIKMPGMSGLEMVKIITDIYTDIPIIVLSAFSEPEYFIKAIDLKVNHFLTKPVDIPKLIDMIQAISIDLSIKNELAEKRTLLDQYKHIVDLSTNITRTDKKGNLTYVNDRFCISSGYTKEYLIGKSHNVIRHPDMSKRFYEKLWKTIFDKKVWQGIMKNRCKDGTDFYVETTISPILDQNENIIEFISISTDITSLKLKKKELQSQIITDQLTGLHNRIKLHEDIKNIREATLIIFDINNFKEINLLFGFSLGDETLIYMADTITKLITSFDNATLYRLSSDEFAIYKPGNNSMEFQAFSHTLKEYINAHPFKFKETSFDIRFTCGIGYKNGDKKILLELTQDALSSAKNDKHFLHIFNEKDSRQKEYEQNFEWTKKIKEALEDARIRVYFQPIYDLQLKTITKYECLVRLIEKDGTAISPFVFLNIAKRSHLYLDITKAVITQGCETFRSRKENITINVSIEDLLDEDTIEFFINEVAKNNMQGRVIAEVLESEGVDNFEIFSKVLSRLKKNGIGVAIDDFGSGYSNFSYLAKLDIDILKIDGSLVRNIKQDINSKILVQSIVIMARELGMRTVAEFVSDKEIFEIVSKLGIDLIQGYYISEPLEKPNSENIILKV